MINAAIVGMGWWGRTLVESVQSDSNVIRFVSGATRTVSPEVKTFAETQQLRLVDSFEALLTDKSVDAVVLATPHSLHAEQIVAAAGAGKAVFCEKPLALGRADAERAVDACRRAGVPLGIGHDKSFWPSMRELKRVVTGGELGRLLHVEGHFSNESTRKFHAGWRESQQESPGGSLTATGIHIINAFVTLLGPVRGVDARLVAQPSDAEPLDTVSVFLEFENGATGVLCGVRTTPQYWRVHVFGADGSAEAIGDTELVLRATDASPRQLRFEPVEALRLELEAFADAVAGRAPYPIAAEQVVHDVAVLEAALRSIETKAPVRIAPS